MVIKCDKCFVSHFPTEKFCKKTLSKKQSKARFETETFKMQTSLLNNKSDGSVKNKSQLIDVPRLRGGLGKASIIVDAIESARKHNISLCAEILNNANGDCLFESVIYNINGRECYNRKLTRSPLYYRVEWISMLERLQEDYPLIGAGYTDEQKKEKRFCEIFK